MEKHNLELNSACSSTYQLAVPQNNTNNKRTFDYENTNSAMNYKVVEEELVVNYFLLIFPAQYTEWIFNNIAKAINILNP